MAGFFASCNREAIMKGSITIPFYGTWSADIDVDTGAPIKGPVTLVLGPLTLQGSAYRSDVFAGIASARIVGGGGGWGKSLPSKAYNLPGGVPVSMVLGDAAIECGEKVSGASGTLGAFWVRDQAPAARTLRLMAGTIWWMDMTGTTQLLPRPTPTIRSAFEVISDEPGSGRVVVATESPQDWVPGAIFSSPTTAPTPISSVTHTLTNAGIGRTEILIAT
jgi:hypothetical protein